MAAEGASEVTTLRCYTNLFIIIYYYYYYVFGLSVRMCVRARWRDSPTGLPSTSSFRIYGSYAAPRVRSIGNLKRRYRLPLKNIV